MPVTTVDIIKTIAEHLSVSPDDLDPGALLREDLGLNTIELNDLIGFIGNKFKISFDAQEIQNIKSIEDLINLTEDGLIDSEF